MFTIESFTTFLGWCSVINIGLLSFSGIMIMSLRRPIMKIHGCLMGVDEIDLPMMYFKYLGNYKIMVIVFNIVPYLVLKFAM